MLFNFSVRFLFSSSFFVWFLFWFLSFCVIFSSCLLGQSVWFLFCWASQHPGLVFLLLFSLPAELLRSCFWALLWVTSFWAINMNPFVPLLFVFAAKMISNFVLLFFVLVASLASNQAPPARQCILDMFPTCLLSQIVLPNVVIRKFNLPPVTLHLQEVGWSNSFCNLSECSGDLYTPSLVVQWLGTSCASLRPRDALVWWQHPTMANQQFCGGRMVAGILVWNSKRHVGGGPYQFSNAVNLHPWWNLSWPCWVHQFYQQWGGKSLDTFVNSGSHGWEQTPSPIRDPSSQIHCTVISSVLILCWWLWTPALMLMDVTELSACIEFINGLMDLSNYWHVRAPNLLLLQHEQQAQT